MLRVLMSKVLTLLIDSSVHTHGFVHLYIEYCNEHKRATSIKLRVLMSKMLTLHIDP